MTSPDLARPVFVTNLSRSRHPDSDVEYYEPPGIPIQITELNQARAARGDLLISSWLDRPIPPRDFLLGNLLCTTSRWLVFGETGVGKTLVSLEMAGAIAAGKSFLNWPGRRPSRVLYLDGELPAETFKERMQLVADRYGAEIALYGYSREVLGEEEMPPLNTDAGQAWLYNEIALVKPDVIFFDSIMCLLGGSMSEEESWAPMKTLVRQLSAKHVAQVWLHHAGHDATRGFGTKTREWEMDTVLALSKADEDRLSIKLEFKKARLRTPATEPQFATQVIRRGDDAWSIELETRSATGRAKDGVALIREEYLKIYHRLAGEVALSPGFDGAPVRKVSVDGIRDELKNRGYLETTETGAISATSRSHLQRAKTDLLKKTLVEENRLIWKI